MRFIFRSGVVLVLLFCLNGCSHGINQNSVSVGMTAEQVKTILGSPKILGGSSRNINGNVTLVENWTYPMGDDGLVIEMENGKVKSKKVRPNLTRAWLKKVHEGMSKQDVITALGDTTQKLKAPPPNPVEKEPTEKWFYTDPEAPIEILLVHFRNDRVVKAECQPNGIYTGQTGPGMPAIPGPH